MLPHALRVPELQQVQRAHSQSLALPRASAPHTGSNSSLRSIRSVSGRWFGSPSGPWCCWVPWLLFLNQAARGTWQQGHLSLSAGSCSLPTPAPLLRPLPGPAGRRGLAFPGCSATDKLGDTLFISGCPAGTSYPAMWMQKGWSRHFGSPNWSRRTAEIRVWQIGHLALSRDG